jgi:hypothetical protein
MTKTASTTANPTSWATAAGRAVVERAAATNGARERQEATAARVREVGAAEGPRWFDEFVACLGSAVRAFNATIGRDVVRVVPRDGSTGLVIRCDGSNASLWASWVGSEAPGLYFAERVCGRDVMRSFPCAVDEDGALAVSLAGEAVGPAAAAERLLAPWLRGLVVR